VNLDTEPPPKGVQCLERERLSESWKRPASGSTGEVHTVVWLTEAETDS